MMRQLVIGAAAACAVVMTGCSSSPGPATTPSAAVPSSTAGGYGASIGTAPGATVTRWWGNSAESAGSTVDPADPAAAAADLKPSRDDYCEMLKQTVAAGHSLFPSASAADPALHTAAIAFVNELQHVAPTEVAASWQVLGNFIITLVQANGNPSAVQAVDSAKVSAAVATVSSDAQSRCGVSLSTAH
jgi:hypothetical protein